MVGGSGIAAGAGDLEPSVVPRVALGPGAPDAMAGFIADAGIEVLPFTQRHAAGLYVDFVGARPSKTELLSIDLQGRSGGTPRFDADLVTNEWQTAACLVISSVLRLRPPLTSEDGGTLAVIRSAIGVAQSPVPMIIAGEIGAGKYNLARLCHHASGGPGSIISLNCARFEELDTAALFKAVAKQELRGQKVMAWLFLDEVGELSDAAQLKLLDLLQAGERTVWSNPAGVAPPPVRFIAATNRALPAMVERGEFRRELYWRLNVFALEIPPLRQRHGDIAMLARYFLRRANPKRQFTPTALRTLCDYAFPGNIIELESLIARIAIAPLATGPQLIDVADIRRYLALSSPHDTPISGWKSSREEARREMILRTIAAAGGNRLEAAKRLGITLRALQYHITKAGLSRRRLPRVVSGDSVLPANKPITSISRQ